MICDTVEVEEEFDINKSVQVSIEEGGETIEEGETANEEETKEEQTNE